MSTHFCIILIIDKEEDDKKHNKICRDTMAPMWLKL